MRTVYKHKTSIGDFEIVIHTTTKRHTCWFMGGLISPVKVYKSKAEAKRYLVEAMRRLLQERHAMLNTQLYNIERNLETLPRLR